MQTTATVKFTRTLETPPVGGDRGNLLLVHDETDNKTTLEKYEEAYQEEHNKLPDYASREDRDLYITMLEASLLESYTQKVRCYNVDKPTMQLAGVRHGGIVIGSTKTEVLTESITVQGSTSVSAKYPIHTIKAMTSDLRDKFGAPISGDPKLGEDHTMNFDVEVYGFIDLTYENSYIELQITTSTQQAVDKLSSILICHDQYAETSAEIAYPDVVDKFMGVEPDKPRWKVTIQKGKQHMDDVSDDAEEDNTVVGTVFTEYARTVSQVDIDGVVIDRAETVSFKSEDDSELKLIFTSMSTPPETGGA